MRRAYVSIGSLDFVRPFDETSRDLVDLNSSFKKSVPDVPVAGPDGVLLTTDATNENAELLIAAGNEVYVHDIVGDQLVDLDAVAPGAQGAAFTAPTPGVSQMAMEPDGKFAFVLHGDTAVGALHVQKMDNATPPTAIPTASRFRSFSEITHVPGIARDLVVKRIDATDFAVYVTSTCTNCAAGNPLPDPNTPLIPNCPPTGGGSARLDTIEPHLGGVHWPLAVAMVGTGGFDMFGGFFADLLQRQCMPGSCTFELCPDGSLPDSQGHCGGGGGGGGGPVEVPRRVMLAVRILRAHFDPADPTMTFLRGTNPWTVECADNYELSHDHVIGEQPWPQAGLDFNADRSRLYVTNPEADTLMIMDTSTNEWVAPGGVPIEIPVGVDPFDVVVMSVDLLGTPGERVYVANHGDEAIATDDSLSVIDPLLQTMVNTVDLDQEFTTNNLDVLYLYGSEVTGQLYLVSQAQEKVLRLRFDSTPDLPAEPGKAFVGRQPRRMALQE